MRAVGNLAILFVLSVLSFGCASTPARFYRLSAVGEPAAQRTDLSVVVGPVSVPLEVDRPEIVVQAGPNQVRLNEFNLWASPLQNNISRVVAENLGALLGTQRVTLFPETLSVDADYRTSIEVQRFVSTPGVDALVDAVWTVRRMNDDKTDTGRTTAREPVRENTYEALAAAHSRALGRLSRDIANAVRALELSSDTAGSAKAGKG